MLSEYIQELEKDSRPKEGAILKLNFNYRSIKVIDSLNQRFQFIKELYLNHNQIESLKGIEQFVNLEEFHIKFNYINSLEELERIKNKSNLRILNLKGNPVEKNSKCCFDFLHNSFPYLNELNENVRYGNLPSSGSAAASLKDNFNTSRGTRSISYSNFNNKNKQKLISNATELSQMLENTLQRQNSCSGLKSYRTPHKSGTISLLSQPANNITNINEINNVLITERNNPAQKLQNNYSSSLISYNNNVQQNGQESSRNILNGMLSMRLNSSNSTGATPNSTSNNNIGQQSKFANASNHQSVNINQIINQNKSSQNIGIINQFLNTHSSRVNSLEKQVIQESSSHKQYASSNSNNHNGSLQNKYNLHNQYQPATTSTTSPLYSHTNNVTRQKSLSNYSTNIGTVNDNHHHTAQTQNNFCSQNQPNSAFQSNLFGSKPNIFSEASQFTTQNGGIQSCFETVRNNNNPNHSGEKRSQSQHSITSNINNLINNQPNQEQQHHNLQRKTSTSSIIANAINKLNNQHSQQQGYAINNALSPNQRDTTLQNSQNATVAGGGDGNSLISFNQSKLHMFQQYQLSFKKDQGLSNSNQKSRQNSEHSLANMNSNKNISNYQKDNVLNAFQPTNRKLFPTSENVSQFSSLANGNSLPEKQDNGLQRFVPSKANFENLGNNENFDSQRNKSPFASKYNSSRDNHQINGNYNSNTHSNRNLVNLYSNNNNNNNNNNILSNLTSVQSRFIHNNQQSQIDSEQENNADFNFDKSNAVLSEYTTLINKNQQYENLEINKQDSQLNQLYQQQQYNSSKNSNNNNIHMNYNSQSKLNQPNQNQSISFISNDNYHGIPTNNRYGTNDQAIQNQQQQGISSNINPPCSMPISTETDYGIQAQSNMMNNVGLSEQIGQSDVIQPILSTTSVDNVIQSSISMNPHLQSQQQQQQQQQQVMLQIRNSGSNESLFSKGVSNHMNQTTATFAKQSKLLKDNTQEGGPFKFVKSSNQQIVNGVLVNPKMNPDFQQSYNNYPLDTQNNPLDTDLSFDTNLVNSQNTQYNQSKMRKRGFSLNNGQNQNHNSATGGTIHYSTSNQQATSQNQFSQQSQQLQSNNYNEMASLNLSRISHINGKSFMNISIPHIKFDGGVFESQAQFQIDDDHSTIGANNNSNPNQSTHFLSVPVYQRKSVIISELVNQNKHQASQNQQLQGQVGLSQPDNSLILRQSNILNKSTVFCERLNQHIENIDTDIEQLAIFFYQKSLKEKAFKSFFYLKAFNNIESKNKPAKQDIDTSSKYNSSMKNSTHVQSVKNESPHIQNSNRLDSGSQQFLKGNSSMSNLHPLRQSPHPHQSSSPNLTIPNKQSAQNSFQKQSHSEQLSQDGDNNKQNTNNNDINEGINAGVKQGESQIPNNQLQSINDCSALLLHQNTFNYSEDEMLITQHDIPLQRSLTPPRQQQDQQFHRSQQQLQYQQNQYSSQQMLLNQQQKQQMQFQQHQQQQYSSQLSGVAKEIETEEISFEQVKQQSNIQQKQREQKMQNEFYSSSSSMNPVVSIANNPLDEIENDLPPLHNQNAPKPIQFDENKLISKQSPEVYPSINYDSQIRSQQQEDVADEDEEEEEEERDPEIVVRIRTAKEYYENSLKIKIFFEWKTFTQNRKIKDKMFLNLSNIKKGLIALNSGRGDLTTNRTQKDTFRNNLQSSASSHKQQQSQCEFDQIQSTMKNQQEGCKESRLYPGHHYNNLKQNQDMSDPYLNSIPQFEESSSDFYSSTGNNESHNMQQYQEQQNQLFIQSKYSNIQPHSSSSSTTPTNIPNNGCVLNEIKPNYQQNSASSNEDKYQRLKLNPSINTKNINQQIIDQNNNKRKEMKNCNLPRSNNIFDFKKNPKTTQIAFQNENIKKY